MPTFTPILKVFNASSKEWTPNLDILSQSDVEFLEILNDTSTLLSSFEEHKNNLTETASDSGFFSFILDPAASLAVGISNLLGTVSIMMLGFAIEWIVLPAIIILATFYFLKYLICKFVFNCKSS